VIGNSIHAYLRAAGQASRPTVRTGPFLALLHPTSPNPFLNYAIPDDDAEPTAAEAAALQDVFREHQRIPRVEYVHEAAPGVCARLVATGFVLERALPVLTCHADSLIALPAPDGFEVGLAETLDDHLGALIVGHEAYAAAGPPPGLADAERRMAFASEGGLVVLARELATGEPAASAICEPPHDGVTELAAVGTRAAFRRRGLAGAVTSRLAIAAARVGGHDLWLTPESPQAERVYGHIGFERCGLRVFDLRALPET
jgi:predicted GNAT family acetyltransferase